MRFVDFLGDFLGRGGNTVIFHHKYYGAISSQTNTFVMGDAVFVDLCKSYLWTNFGIFFVQLCIVIYF